MNRAYVNWVDAYGGERLVWYSYVAGGVLTPFATAIDNLANPSPSTVVASTLQVLAPSPSTNQYPLVTDSAVLTFSTGTGRNLGVVVPGFKESLYLADNQTVDPAQPLVLAAIAQSIGFLVDSAGNLATAYIGGLRQRRGY